MSELRLTELPSDASARADLTEISFSLARSPRDTSSAGQVCAWPHGNGDQAVSLSSASEGLVLRFPDLAEFLVAEDGRRVVAWPFPGIAVETLRHLLLDQVLPRVLAWRGRLVLHAGAASVGGRAVAFLGPSGRGKSTLVASFHGAGYPAMTDDGLVIDTAVAGAFALPTYVGLRVWPDSAAAVLPDAPSLGTMAPDSSKRRVGLEATAVGAAGPLPLAALFDLDEAPGAGSPPACVERLSSRDGCMAIIASSFQLDLTDRACTARLLDVAAEVAIRVPVFRISYARDFSLLGEVRRAVLESRGEWAGGPGGAMDRGAADG